MRHLLSLVPLLVATGLARSAAQLLGLWEEQDGEDGVAVGAPSRACSIGGAPVTALQPRPPTLN